MKILVVGYSGSGKSTIAQKLGQKFNITPLHMDSVHWLEGWKEREFEDEKLIISTYLNEHDNWIIEGNYFKLEFERRLEEADLIIIMTYGRLTCLRRAFKRYKRYRGASRPDMASGCDEKFDLEFIKWILFGSRKKKTRKRYRLIKEKYESKTVWIKNQRQCNMFLNLQNKD